MRSESALLRQRSLIVTVTASYVICYSIIAHFHFTAKNSSEPPTAYVISAGLEPHSFCGLFPTWNYYETVAQLHIEVTFQKWKSHMYQYILSHFHGYCFVHRTDANLASRSWCKKCLLKSVIYTLPLTVTKYLNEDLYPRESTCYAWSPTLTTKNSRFV